MPTNNLRAAPTRNGGGGTPSAAADANQAARTKLPELADLVDDWVRGKLDDVDAIVGLAEERARKIPHVGELRREVDALRLIVSELLIRVTMLEGDR